MVQRAVVSTECVEAVDVRSTQVEQSARQRYALAMTSSVSEAATVVEAAQKPETLPKTVGPIRVREPVVFLRVPTMLPARMVFAVRRQMVSAPISPLLASHVAETISATQAPALMAYAVRALVAGPVKLAQVPRPARLTERVPQSSRVQIPTTNAAERPLQPAVRPVSVMARGRVRSTPLLRPVVVRTAAVTLGLQ